MILYRSMCDQELEDMKKFNSLSWNSKFKWFGTEEFVKNRVRDNKFNNSKFVPDRYKNLVKFTIDDNSIIHFNKCGNREFMLNIRKANSVKILNWEIISWHIQEKIGSRKYIFNTIDDYLLGLEIMGDLQEVFEERMGYCDTTFEFSDAPKLEEYRENS